MSFIIFDYRCTECGRDHPNKMVRRSEMDEQLCTECESLMTRLPAAPITNFKMHDRSAIKSKKAVSLMDPRPGADIKNFTSDLD